MATTPPSPQLPAIPTASNLPTALSAIQALTQAVRLLAGQFLSKSNNVAPGTQTTAAVKPNAPSTISRFTEVPGTRVTVQVALPVTGGGGGTVTINQINAITWQDQVTGQTILWQR
jgi:hypothetical protein